MSWVVLSSGVLRPFLQPRNGGKVVEAGTTRTNTLQVENKGRVLWGLEFNAETGIATLRNQ